jgi:hypothetical protein
MAAPNIGGDGKVAMQQTQHVEDYPTEKIEEHQVEIAQYQLNRMDLDLLSKESISIKSRAALRMLLVIVGQGLSR